MELTRYYERKQIDSAGVRAIRDLLSKSFNWSLASAKYSLFYTGDLYSVGQIDEVDGIVRRKGQPAEIRAVLKSEGGRTITIETHREDGLKAQPISISVDNKEEPPEKLLEAIEPILSLKQIDEIPRETNLQSAFIAHSFSDDGQNYATELARFLGLLGIRSQSGRGFAPTSVSEKVGKRLARHDILFSIVTPQDDLTWLTQELATAHALNKSIFILKHSAVDLKSGILGDHEFIPFPDKQLSKTFIPILEGLGEIRGEESGYLS